MILIVGIVLAALGLLFLYWGFHESGVVRDLKQNGTLVNATVIEVYNVRNKRTIQWTITYEFPSSNETTQTGSKSFSGPQNPLPEGSSLAVVYSPADPSRNRPAEDVEHFGNALFILGLGVLFAVIGFVMVLDTVL